MKKFFLLLLLSIALVMPSAVSAFAASTDTSDEIVWALDFTNGNADTSLLSFTNNRPSPLRLHL